MGLKVNVMHITLHGGGLNMSKTASVLIGSNMFLFLHIGFIFLYLYIYFIFINLACACPLFLFHGTLFSFIINLSPCQTSNIILSPYQAST